MIPSNPQNSSTVSPIGDSDPQTIPEIPSPHRASHSPQEEVIPLPKMSEVLTESDPEEEKDKQSYRVTESEDENEDETDKDDAGDEMGYTQDKELVDDDDDDEEEGFDEVVVKPRPLNEITSLTDRTSPWTSILSDPDLASLDSVEEPEDLNPRQDEEEEQKMLNMQSPDCSGQHKCGRQDKSASLNGSAGDASDIDSDDERTLCALDERQAREANSPEEESNEKGSSSVTQDATDAPDTSSSLVSQDGPHQAYP